MKFLIFVFLCIALLNVDALSKKKLSNTMKIREAIPPNSDYRTTFLQGESSTFELFNFYEYTFYVKAYELYNDYFLNKDIPCYDAKLTYWFGKKLDANSIANFCKLIGTQINSSYLNNYLCGYIEATFKWFDTCAYDDDETEGHDSKMF